MSFLEQHQHQWVRDSVISKCSCHSSHRSPHFNEERISAWIHDRSVVTKANLRNEGIQVVVNDWKFESNFFEENALSGFSSDIVTMGSGKSLEELRALCSSRMFRRFHHHRISPLRKCCQHEALLTADAERRSIWLRFQVLEPLGLCRQE